jgi:hypothetical protein
MERGGTYIHLFTCGIHASTLMQGATCVLLLDGRSWSALLYRTGLSATSIQVINPARMSMATMIE